MAAVEGILDVQTDLAIKNPQMSVEIDRERAAIYGISIEQIRQEMFNAFGSRQVATIFTADNDFAVILETRPEFQTDTAALSRIHIKTSSGLLGPAGGGHPHHAQRRSAGGEPSGRAAGSDDLVQSRAGPGARHREDAIDEHRARNVSGHRGGQFPRRRAGVRGFAERAS